MGNKGFCANLLLFRVKIRYHKAMDIFCRIVKISSAKYLCLFCLIFLSVEALAARWAVIGVSRAKIYSDVKMTKVSLVGYLINTSKSGGMLSIAKKKIPIDHL